MNRTESLKPVRSAILATIFWTIAVGGIYPLVMFGVGQLFFPHKAQGSFVEAGGKVVGSALIGQSFDNDGYFQSRPSAIGYDSSNSGASGIWPRIHSRWPSSFLANRSPHLGQWSFISRPNALNRSLVET